MINVKLLMLDGSYFRKAESETFKNYANFATVLFINRFIDGEAKLEKKLTENRGEPSPNVLDVFRKST